MFQVHQARQLWSSPAQVTGRGFSVLLRCGYGVYLSELPLPGSGSGEHLSYSRCVCLCVSVYVCAYFHTFVSPGERIIKAQTGLIYFTTSHAETGLKCLKLKKALYLEICINILQYLGGN